MMSGNPSSTAERDKFDQTAENDQFVSFIFHTHDHILSRKSSLQRFPEYEQ